MTRRDLLDDLAGLFREPAEDPYLVVGRMLRERYGPIDVRARIAGDPKIRAMLAELAEELRALPGRQSGHAAGEPAKGVPMHNTSAARSEDEVVPHLGNRTAQPREAPQRVINEDVHVSDGPVYPNQEEPGP